MKFRTLGSEGPKISALGLGCMRMSPFTGTVSFGKSGDDDESIATIHAALDSGINYLDTGDFYGSGHNESLVGKAIRDRRDQAFVGVKFGVLRAPWGAFLGADLRPAAVMSFASYSLQRLGVDVIDLYQPGRLDPTIPVEDTVGAIAELIRQGKVRYLGLSEVSAEQLRKAHRVHPVSVLQIEYSLATRFIEREILATARELGISIVAYNVTAHGLLAGSASVQLGPNDPRTRLSRFSTDNLPRNLQTVSALDSMAEAKGYSPIQISIAWLLSRGEDIIPLVGLTRRTHLADNLSALDISLSEDELQTLDRAFAPGAIVGDRAPAEVMRFSPS